MADIQMEQIRGTVLLLQKSIEIIDGVSEAIAENRIKFEALRRMPQLGQTPQGLLTPDKLKGAIDGLLDQQREHEEIVKYLTGAETVEAAREAYLRLLTAFQRVTTLLELDRMVAAGFPGAIKEGTEAYGVSSKFAIRAEIEHDLILAKTNLAEVNATVTVPPISDISIPTTSLRLS